MTIRAQINRRFRTMSWLIYLGMALFFVDFIAGNVLNLPEWTWGFGIVGFVVAWVTMVAAWVSGSAVRPAPDG